MLPKLKSPTKTARPHSNTIATKAVNIEQQTHNTEVNIIENGEPQSANELVGIVVRDDR